MINEITEEDKLKIFDLFFEKMYNIERIEAEFKGKYKYSQIASLTRKKIGDYNGHTRKIVKRTISWRSLEQD